MRSAEAARVAAETDAKRLAAVAPAEQATEILGMPGVFAARAMPDPVARTDEPERGEPVRPPGRAAATTSEDDTATTEATRAPGAESGDDAGA